MAAPAFLPRPGRTLVMGVLNVTPDSFSDGGRFLDPAAAVERALAMEAEGADIVDVGGESTRPGSEEVETGEEIRRVVPVIERLRGRLRVPISIDTRKAAVARAAAAAGAAVLNDISGLRFDPGMAEAAAELRLTAILMHIRGTPKTMQEAPSYGDAAAEVRGALAESIAIAERAGVAPDRIWVDPGIGFGKRLEDNLVLLNRLPDLRALGKPILVGPSRKSFIGKILDLPVEERLEGTLAAVAAAVLRGADAVRVHDVKGAVRACRVAEAIRREKG